MTTPDALTGPVILSIALFFAVLSNFIIRGERRPTFFGTRSSVAD